MSQEINLVPKIASGFLDLVDIYFSKYSPLRIQLSVCSYHYSPVKTDRFDIAGRKLRVFKAQDGGVFLLILNSGRHPERFRFSIHSTYRYLKMTPPQFLGKVEVRSKPRFQDIDLEI